MICVSVAEKSLADCLKVMKGLELAEIRLDLVPLENEAIEKVFSQQLRLVATCRPGRISDRERKQKLECAIKAGATYVDIELEADEAYRRDLINTAWAHSADVIVSYHDYKGTPERRELSALVEQCFEKGANVAKIACQVNAPEDAARLIGLLDDRRRVVVAGMGEGGKLVRVVAPLLGAEFTFASAGSGRETAPGQIGVRRLREILGDLKAALE